MPATDTYWRNLKKMHVVFVLSAIGLFAVTIGMMWADHHDEWRDYQSTFDLIEEKRLEGQIEADKTAEYKARLDELEAELKAANEKYEQDKGDVEDEIETLAYQLDLAERELRAQRAFRDKARADYDLAIRDNRTEAAGDLKEKFDAEQAKVDKLELKVQNLNTQLAQAKQRQQDLKDDVIAIESEIAAMKKEVERLEATKNRIAPESRFSAIKRKVMQWPIIDGFNSPHQIKQVWLPDMKITLGMASTARFDRCQTCHLGIDRTETGNVPSFPHGEDLIATAHADADTVKKWVEANEYPHPYSTHPNPDLFLSSTSPHPTEEFGCTICHDGQGSGTSFDNVQHTPNDPHQHEHWQDKYHYHPNHFWEYPMQPERFRESTCLKCHHQVVELETSPQFGNSAPKLVEGFHTVQQFGCFGCHEIHGQDGADSIGPDLRLEPNYFAIALQIAAACKEGMSVPVSGNEEVLADIGRLNRILNLANQVADDPEDAETERHELQQLVLADIGLEKPLFDARIHGLAEDLKDQENPGSYRKVGPSLRYVGRKTTQGWLEHWTIEPKRFRPTTRMPQFFHLTNQEDETAKAYQPVQVAAIGHYLLSKTQPLQLDRPEEGYIPQRGDDGKYKAEDQERLQKIVDRGKKLFAERGCLACHTHKDFPEIKSDFGPNLDKVYAKVKAGEEGFNWVYSWIRDPERYHKRTKMPNLFLRPEDEKGAGAEAKEGAEANEKMDPAADIAAYLLQDREQDPPSYEVYKIDTYDVVVTGAGDTPESVASLVAGANGLDEADAVRRLGTLPHTVKEGLPRSEADALAEKLKSEGAQVEVMSDLDRLVRLYLAQALTINQMEDLGKTKLYPYKPEQIKGDEIELVYQGAGEPSEEEWQAMKLNYVGRRTISQYGCYGCHDIPGFEAAKPIGTALQDWGRKDTSRLAFEHIQEFLHHHNAPGSDETLVEQAQNAVKRAKADEFKSEEEEQTALSKAFYYDSILHHGRPGFIWQKLRQPRSYDYKKTETKRYDERLRMPKFPLDDDEVEAIATFVLGLTAEPPAEKYLFKPKGATEARYEGELLLNKYNCTSCHMVELPEIRQMVERRDEDQPSTYSDYVGMTRDEIIDWFVKNREQILNGTLTSYPSDIQLIETLSDRFGLGMDVKEIVQLANITPGDLPGRPAGRNGNALDERIRGNLREWFTNHPEVLLAGQPATDELPSGILKLLKLKPPQEGETTETTADGDAIIRFHGLLAGPPDLESPPEEQFQSYQLWETLDVGGRVFLPGKNMSFTTPQLVSVSQGRGGAFTDWLVNRLWVESRSNPQDIAAIPKARQSSPPPLYMEGLKVQTPWLFQFLKNPEVIRHETVLRMPRFNMSDREAQALANYFAAVDDSEYPYQPIREQEDAYLAKMNQSYQQDFADEAKEHEDYLARSWHMLGKNPLCVTCHSVMGREFQATPAPSGEQSQVTHGPDLDTRVPSRLRPDWLEVWLNTPRWMLPYTGMPAPHTKPQAGYFGQDPERQTRALRDALINYNRLMQAEGVIEAPPPDTAVPANPPPQNP